MMAMKTTYLTTIKKTESVRRNYELIQKTIYDRLNNVKVA